MLQDRAKPAGFAPWEVDPEAPAFAMALKQLDATPTPQGYLGTLAGGAFAGYHRASRLDLSRCQMSPTCSRFAHQALNDHGLAATPRIFARLMRGHFPSPIYAQHAGQVGPLHDPVSAYVFFPERGYKNGSSSPKALPWQAHLLAAGQGDSSSLCAPSSLP